MLHYASHGGYRPVCEHLALHVLNEQAGRGHKVTNSDTEKENPMMNIVKRLWNEENGQDLAEYALIMAIIALGATVAMTSLKTAVSTTFSNVASNLTAGS